MNLEQEDKLIKSREIYLIYEPTLFSLARGVRTTFSNEDLVNIYRQVKRPKLKQQIKEFIEFMDSQQGIKSDLDNYKLPKTQKEEPDKRVVKEYSHKKEVV